MAVFSIMISGNTNSCRTEAEIELTGKDREPILVGLVYEAENGWQQEIIEKSLVAGNEKEFTATVDKAKNYLEEYINRRGENFPDGLTMAGLSFWLMKKKDGTSMGREYKTSDASPDD